MPFFLPFFSISGTSVDFDFCSKNAIVSDCRTVQITRNKRYYLFMIFSGINCLVLLKLIQVGVGIIVKYQKP